MIKEKSKMRILREHEPHPVPLREEKEQEPWGKTATCSFPVLSGFVWDPELNQCAVKGRGRGKQPRGSSSGIQFLMSLLLLCQLAVEDFSRIEHVTKSHCMFSVRTGEKQFSPEMSVLVSQLKRSRETLWNWK